MIACQVKPSPGKLFKSFKASLILNCYLIFFINTIKLGGSVLTVENEGLALAVAQEWQSQENIVQLSQV